MEGQAVSRPVVAYVSAHCALAITTMYLAGVLPLLPSDVMHAWSSHVSAVCAKWPQGQGQ